MREVEEIDQMTETRVVKSHLPLYLLNPKLLDTSKVSINDDSRILLNNQLLSYHRLCMLHETLKMSSSLTFITTG